VNPTFEHASADFRRLNPALFPDVVAARIPHTVTQRALPPALVHDHQGQDRGPAGCPPRHHVRFTLHRCRLLDADNAVGSVKFVLDALVAEGLLPGDGPDQLTLAVEQVRVATRAAEGVQVVISPDPPPPRKSPWRNHSPGEMAMPDRFS
jgi:hypothetical protein